ncbi:hypothetical protein ACT691_05005, partial [Vibrio metschnikovii]
VLHTVLLKSHRRTVGERLWSQNLVDAISVRLPTICIRPAVPNQAASSFKEEWYDLRTAKRSGTSNCPVDLAPDRGYPAQELSFRIILYVDRSVVLSRVIELFNPHPVQSYATHYACRHGRASGSSSHRSRHH